MRPVLSRAQVRAFDAYCIDQCKVPGVVLMENAGRLASDFIAREMLGGDVVGARIVIVCGTGNNGGDGFVIARHLLSRGAAMRVFRVGFVARLSGDARVNHEAYLGVGGVVSELTTEADVKVLRDAIGSAKVVVDALFGTGLDRPIAGRTVEVVKMMSDARCKRVAVDIPSGLDADTGAPLGVCMMADATVTFGHLKLGLLTPHGARYAGALHVADLGVPPLLSEAATPSAELVEREDVAALFKPRAPDVHKHGAGHLCVFGGSDGKVGAPLMVARGALRTGAGLVTIATWSESVDVLQSRVTEEMTTTLSRGDVIRSVEAAIKGKRAVVVGPGFGLDDNARLVVNTLLEQWKGPALYDADALTLLAGSPESFATAATPVVLTPHTGELARLLGSTSDAIEADRFTAARTLAARARAVVVLKGASTLIAHPGGRVVINATGNAALATAGSGDTLAGIIGALLCTMDAFEAAYAGVYLHGLAADTWSAAHGDRGLLATEIAELVPEAIAGLAGLVGLVRR